MPSPVLGEKGLAGLTSGCLADPPYAVGYSSSCDWALISSMACLTQLILAACLLRHWGLLCLDSRVGLFIWQEPDSCPGIDGYP